MGMIGVDHARKVQPSSSVRKRRLPAMMLVLMFPLMASLNSLYMSNPSFVLQGSLVEKFNGGLSPSLLSLHSGAKLTVLPLSHNASERNITFVHIGKAGGESIMSVTSLHCPTSLGKRKEVLDLRLEEDPCMTDRFGPPNRYKLPWLVKWRLHIFTVPEPYIEDVVTSYIVSIRHPVDRLVSAYKYMHPALCNMTSGFPRLACRRNRTINNGGMSDVNKFYNISCRDLDILAHSAIPDTDRSHNSSLASSSECEKVALASIQGHIPESVNWHILYNYEYYAKLSIYAHPEKEVFVIRTSSLWEDLDDLELLLGGNMTLGTSMGVVEAHGKGLDMTIRRDSYLKLCCAAIAEFQPFEDFINRAVNLDDSTKRRTIHEAYLKCGVVIVDDLDTSEVAISRWKEQCRDQVQRLGYDKKPRWT